MPIARPAQGLRFLNCYLKRHRESPFSEIPLEFFSIQGPADDAVYLSLYIVSQSPKNCESA